MSSAHPRSTPLHRRSRISCPWCYRRLACDMEELRETGGRMHIKVVSAFAAGDSRCRPDDYTPRAVLPYLHLHW